MSRFYFPRITIFIIFFFTQVVLFAQNDKTGSWNIANLTYHLNNKFALYTEVQARSQLLINDFFYHEFKGGIFYYLPRNNSLFFGFGNYETYTFPGDFKRPVTANEYRIWEQFVLNNNIGRIKIEHRYRIEQRWINSKYFNRFRYRLNPVVPLNNSTMLPRTFFVTAFEEVFFTDKTPYFIRNRVFAGVGYEFTKLFIFQIGFIRQFDYRTSDEGSGKNYIQSSLMFNVNHTKIKREVHPSNMD